MTTGRDSRCGLVDFGLAEFIPTCLKRPLAEISHANLMTSSEADDEPLMKKAKMADGSDVINTRRETCGCFNNFTVCKICLKRFVASTEALDDVITSRLSQEVR